MPRPSLKVFKKRKNIGKPKCVSVRPTNITPQPLPTNSKTISSSKKKIAKQEEQYSIFSNNGNEKDTYDLVNLDKIEVMLSNIAVCKDCSGKLSVSTNRRLGLSVEISFKCNNCLLNISKRNDNELINNSKSELNTRLVYGMRSIGKGESAAMTLCGIMNLPKPPLFRYYNKCLRDATEDVCKASMKEAAIEAVEENEGNRDIAAAFDGTWQKRGFSSQNGVVTVTSVSTGKVLDVKVLSKYCKCKERFKNIHSEDCTANYQGTSGAMEVSGIVDFFQRSQELHNIRYEYYLGDGDSSAFPTVSQLKPYGPDFKIKKLECVGHVQKRMGSRLRKLKSKMSKIKLADDKTIGGKGRLTEANINTIQLYYGLAIRRNTASLEAMRQAVWAEYFHLISSNDEPAHALCPKGDETWCKYQKSIANKETYDHNEHCHLPVTVMETIKPIFKSLSSPELLEKCLHGGTQNPNESVNNVIWSRIPKRTFVQLASLEFGVYDAVTTFNKGHITKCLVLSKLGINPGVNCVRSMKKFDESRVYKAERSLEDIQKKCRQKSSLAKRHLEDLYQQAEDPDNPAYGPGLH